MRNGALHGNAHVLTPQIRAIALLELRKHNTVLEALSTSASFQNFHAATDVQDGFCNLTT